MSHIPNTIHNVLIVGGTHGNEMSGLAMLSSKVQLELNQAFGELNVQFEMGNPAAIQQNVRFTDDDLNRQFTLENLGPLHTNVTFEANRARELNAKWGPKNASNTDLVIDIHNTTSAMGATLIILELDAFHIGLARYVKQCMPQANILVEDEKNPLEHPYLCTIGKRGVMIEVGAQPQGVCRAEMSELTLSMTKHILAYCQQFNDCQNHFESLSEVEAFRLTGTEYYPENIENISNADTTNNVTNITSNITCRDWAIHPNLQDNDYAPLHKGDPVFKAITGEVIEWKGNTTYPHFINEAAYHKLGVAFTTADLFSI